jgi:thiol-disulfide isomerase/thioredoxin
LPDTSGQVVSIKQFKGKYTLIDFWASWCVPCRKESPLLVKAYKRFNRKGFDIVSVSFDNKRDLWTNAIRKDQYTWINVSELKRWTNSLSQAWFIKSIPSNILVDPAGKIIARNLRGLRLEKKLEELLGS